MNTEITIQKSNQLKSIAILMMLCIHLFNREHNDLFTPLIFVGVRPLSYYVSLFCDAALPIFAFVTGYGLYFSFTNSAKSYFTKNLERLKKLYYRYWIILLIFAVGLGYVLSADGYPGNIEKFVLNMTGLDTTYNGAWWFFTIYVFFVLTSKFWFKLLDNVNPYLLLSIFILIYFAAFYFRIYRMSTSSNPLIIWIHTKSALYFCTLFQFMLGAFALKYNWSGKISKIFINIRQLNLVAIFLIIMLIIMHGIVPNSIVAPFTGIGFIFLFMQIRTGPILNKIIDYFTPHATNMWLIHMFIFDTYFQEIIYAPKYVLFIFLWLVFWCILSSYFVNFIYKKIFIT